ncbi:hypothetical protein [Lottiidibacillus patelloidae]|nr:hypothetical protein [Lottiidibacillus patelloidae]
MDKLLQKFIKEIPTMENKDDLINRYMKSIDDNIDPSIYLKQLKLSYKEFERWLHDLLNSEMISDEIVALNFGLFENEYTIQLYITGSKEWEFDDDDWACNNDYFPKGRYASINIYKELKILLENEFDLGLFMTIATTIILVNTYVTCYPNKLPQNIKLATGFDDGDIYNLN